MRKNIAQKRNEQRKKSDDECDRNKRLNELLKYDTFIASYRTQTSTINEIENKIHFRLSDAQRKREEKIMLKK